MIGIIRDSFRLRFGKIAICGDVGKGDSQFSFAIRTLYDIAAIGLAAHDVLAASRATEF